jgi:hypothetical protein
MFRKMTDTNVTVRHAHAGDAPALARLAALDSAHAPELPVLVAESGARLLAALPLGSGRLIADPFEPTAELVALLQLRAAQLEAGEGSPRRRLRKQLRSLLRVPARA